MSDDNIIKPASGWLLKTAIIFFTAILLLLACFFMFEMVFDNKIYPGIRLGAADLGGLTVEQLKDALEQKINILNQNGIVFKYGDSRYALLPTIASADAELAYNLINIDADKTAESAFFVGRSRNIFSNLERKLSLLIMGDKLSIIYTVNRDEIKKNLLANFSGFDRPGADAKLVYSNENNAFGVIEERSGEMIDYDSALIQLEKQLSVLDVSPIELKTINSTPLIRKNKILNVNPLAQSYLTVAPFILRASSTLATTSEWRVGKNDLAGWLALVLDKNEPAKITVGLGRTAVERYLKEVVGAEIEKKPREAKFEIKNGKVSIFEAGQAGLEIDLAATIDNIENKLIDKKRSEAELVLKESPSSTLNPENDLGIKEVIGVGRSNFAGSPKNRRHNIKVGATTLNGVLISPGEKFSLIKTLGEIGSTSGYLPELVIKGNKTIPEFGGGLCQIGTTMFRGALSTGLPILERRNHSYRVPYYEPAGTDATIYDPSPDLKFENDTGNYILIQSKIVKDDLFFEFWGTDDGRTATQTKPIITNIVRPAPTKLIETLELSAGIKKCTEKAHNGADASFDYKITYADGKVTGKKFNSHYIPWQEVCLIGVTKLSADGTSSTTAKTVNSTATGTSR